MDRVSRAPARRLLGTSLPIAGIDIRAVRVTWYQVGRDGRAEPGVAYARRPEKADFVSPYQTRLLWAYAEAIVAVLSRLPAETPSQRP